MTTQQGLGQIFFCGDVHGNFEHIIDAVKVHQPAAIVLLGDIQAQRPLEQELAEILDKTEVWFIHGNHDTDSEKDYDNLFGSALADRSLNGRVMKIAGVRVAGLGGVFRKKVWAPSEPWGALSTNEFMRSIQRGNRWRDGLPLRHRSTIFRDTYELLAKQGADVLVTHEAPSVHPHGFVALDELAKSLKVHTTFHGHHHDSLDYRPHWAKLGHQAFGVGFRGITALDGTVIRAGDYDTVSRGVVKKLAKNETYSNLVGKAR